VAADVQRFAQVAGQRPDVGSGGAGDGDVHVEDLAAVFAADLVDVETLDRDRAGLQFHLLAGANPGVGALAVDLDRGDLARDLLDLPAQLGHFAFDVLIGHGGGDALGDDVSLG